MPVNSLPGTLRVLFGAGVVSASLFLFSCWI